MEKSRALFILELVDSLVIMLRLTVAYPVVCKCFATVRRMGVKGLELNYRQYGMHLLMAVLAVICSAQEVYSL
jgi:hypothetical protein